jgi:tetratricopeptide (TPR) repeat protein
MSHKEVPPVENNANSGNYQENLESNFPPVNNLTHQEGAKDLIAGRDIIIGRIKQWVFQLTVNVASPFNSQHGRFTRYVAVGVYVTLIAGGFIKLWKEGYASPFAILLLVAGSVLLALTCFYYVFFWNPSIPQRPNPPIEPPDPQDSRFNPNPNATDPERDQYRYLANRKKYSEEYERELSLKQERKAKYEEECKKYEQDKKKRSKRVKQVIIRRCVAAILMIAVPISAIAGFWMWWSVPNTIVTFADYYATPGDPSSFIVVRKLTSDVRHHLESYIPSEQKKNKDIKIKPINKAFNDTERETVKYEAGARKATISIWGQYNKINLDPKDMTIEVKTFLDILKRPLDLLLPEKVRELFEQNSQLYGHDKLELAEVNSYVKEKVKDRLSEPKNENSNPTSLDLPYLTNFVSGVAYYKAALADYKAKKLEVAKEHLDSAIEHLHKSLERLEAIKGNPSDAQLLDKQIVLKFLESVSEFYQGNANVYNANFSKTGSGYDLAIDSFTRAIEFISDYVLDSDNSQIEQGEQFSNRATLVSYASDSQYQLSSNERDDNQDVICGSKKHDKDVLVGNSPAQLKMFLSRIYNNRGVAYAMKGEVEKALADYNKAIRFDSEIDEVCINLGSAYSDMGKYDPAIKNYGNGIGNSTDPENSTAYNNLGNVYMMQGEYQQAIKQYEQAIALDPTSAEAYYNRGRVYFFGRKIMVVKTKQIKI